MANLLKLALMMVTVVVPGGFLMLTLYWGWKRSRDEALDFETKTRRVPITRAPPPSADELRRTRRLLQAR